MVKNTQEMQVMMVLSLGQEEPLEKEMATHSSTLAWKILWMEVPVGLQSLGSQKSQTRLNNNKVLFIVEDGEIQIHPTLNAVNVKKTL